MHKDSLGDRIKQYENIERKYLYKKIPVILRCDGKSFHTFTRGCTKPFDDKIINTMQDTTKFLMENIQGAKIGYVQSDEISILVTDYDKIETCAWFDYNIQKICSIAASMASVQFTLKYDVSDGIEYAHEYATQIKPAYFDCRAFNIPKEDLVNYFRWRYQDWVRNSIQMLAQANYSHKELQGLSCKKLITKLEEEKGIYWDKLDPVYKNGALFHYEDSKFIDNKKNLVKNCRANLNSNEECDVIFKDYV